MFHKDDEDNVVKILNKMCGELTKDGVEDGSGGKCNENDCYEMFIEKVTDKTGVTGGCDWDKDSKVCEFSQGDSVEIEGIVGDIGMGTTILVLVLQKAQLISILIATSETCRDMPKSVEQTACWDLLIEDRYETLGVFVG